MPSEKELLLKKIDRAHLPRHVAIIMDGNGRWAKKRHMPRLFGHRAGAESVRDIVAAAGELGIEVLTLYAFSTENWARPPSEINGLMRLLQQTLKNEASNLNKNNVRLNTIGDLSKLPAYVQDQIQKTKDFLKSNTGLKLVLALNYGGRQELVQAFNNLAREGAAPITEESIQSQLYTFPYPDPDLLIRTSGEFRISNFLLWQLAYTEIYFTPKMWPEFRRQEFYKAVIDFQSRTRRYGAVV